MQSTCQSLPCTVCVVFNMQVIVCSGQAEVCSVHCTVNKDLVRPSLKGGLCMSAGQKNPVIVEVSKFDIRDVWGIQPYFRVGQSIK